MKHPTPRKRGNKASGPAAGTLSREVFDFIKKGNPGVSREELLQRFGDRNRHTVQSILYRIKRFYGTETPQWHHKPLEEMERMVSGDLAETAVPATYIAKKYRVLDGGRESTLFGKLVRKYRGPIFTREGKKEFGTFAFVRGINPDNLRSEFLPLPMAEQRRILQEHAQLVEQAIGEYPIPGGRAEFRRFLLRRLQEGLGKYAPEMCTPRHFVLLVAKNAEWKFLRGEVHEVYLRNLLSMRRQKIVGERELEEIFRKDYKRLEKFCESIGGQEWDEVFAETLHALVLGFDRYDPEKHGEPIKFMEGVAKAIVRVRNRKLTAEKWMKKGLAYEAKLEGGHLQNKPKNTNPRKWDQDIF